MNKKLYLIVLLLAAAVTACKKDKAPSNGDDDGDDYDPALDIVPTTGTEVEKIKDSIYLYSKEDYLWYDALPQYGKFKPREFTGSNTLDAYQQEVDAISQFKINPDTKKPYEYSAGAPGTSKYSFIDEGGVSGELGGEAGDFGFEPRYDVDDFLYVKYVYPGSPAATAGLHRGYRITKVNDVLTASVSDDALVDAFYGSDNIKLELQKPDNSKITVTVSKAEYTLNPVITYKVITKDAHKVGYIVFNSFTSPANANPKLNQAFDYFKDNGVTDMVVDLRYNGGGFVSTAQFISNVIVPAAKTGTTMFTYYFNENLQKNKFDLINKSVFDNTLEAGDFLPANNRVKFAKSGSLNINKVCFLVTGSSASASELTINNLLPHMDVQVIGETTYGKPVGFFAIPIGKTKKYELYIPEFESRNSLDKSNYYAGMKPGTTDFPGKNTFDNVAKDFGDPEENLLKNALNYISKGNYVAVATSSLRTQATPRIAAINAELGNHKFKGMIFDRVKK
jgi:carboxyl-terminal processing protease